MITGARIKAYLGRVWCAITHARHHATLEAYSPSGHRRHAGLYSCSRCRSLDDIESGDIMVGR